MTTPVAREQCLRAADLIPLAPGNCWLYREAESGTTFEIRVIGMASVNRRLYYVVRGFGPETMMLRAREDGALVAWDEAHFEEQVVIAFDNQPEKPFEAHGRGFFRVGRMQAEDRIHEGPAGRWCVAEVRYAGPGQLDAGELIEQYAENIGMVRRRTVTLAGPQVYDLVFAQVGRQVITAGETGRFCLMALPGADGQSWDVRMMVGPTGGTGLKLRFASDQQYELRLRDEHDNVVWTWSMNKQFMRNPQIVNAGGWGTTVNVPHPSGVSQGEQLYALEAWLTAEENEARFAAATTLRMPGSGETVG